VKKKKKKRWKSKPEKKKKMDLSFKINMGRDVCAPVLHPTPEHFGFHVKEEEETKNSYLIWWPQLSPVSERDSFFSFFLLSFPFNVFISRYRWADEKRTGLVKNSAPTTFRFFLFPSQWAWSFFVSVSSRPLFRSFTFTPFRQVCSCTRKATSCTAPEITSPSDSHTSEENGL
jgi:hypothetical protein